MAFRSGYANIIGKPNVGKSSLFNTLLARDRALVSEFAGTTRDAFEEAIEIDGLYIRLIDTAGLAAVSGHPLDQMGMDGGKMLGPLLGGVLWPVVGVGGCFLILAAGYGVNLLLYRGLPPTEPKAGVSTHSVRRNLVEGLEYVVHNPVILGVLAVTVVLNFLGFPYQNLVPVVAKDVLGLGPRLTGLLVATEGFGAVCVALFIASRRRVMPRRRVFVLASGLILGTVLLFSFSRWPWLSFLLLFISGGCISGFATMQSGLILVGASDTMRGRAMGTLILAIGFGPLGALLIGALASILGAPIAITATVGASLRLLGGILW